VGLPDRFHRLRGRISLAPNRALSPALGSARQQAIEFAEKDLKSGSDEYKAVRARAGYAAEGPFMSLKQMSTQILSVEIDEQPKYIDLQRMARGKSGMK
jgi:hypothetical protein